MKTITFANRPPIRTRHEINSIRLGGGGYYQGIGYNDFESINCGGTIHVWQDYSSGCDWGRGVSRSTTYLGAFSEGDYEAACNLVRAWLVSSEYYGERETWNDHCSKAIEDWAGMGWIAIPVCCAETEA